MCDIAYSINEIVSMGYLAIIRQFRLIKGYGDLLTVPSGSNKLLT